MNRRSMLGMLGLGAAVGPAVISNAVNPVTPTGVANYDTLGYSIKNGVNPELPWNPVENLASAKREYDLLMGDPSSWIRDYVTREMDEYINYPSFRFENIDPDIRSMKSFSESAKIRMYIERKARRKFEFKKNSLLSNIQKMMGFHNEL